MSQKKLLIILGSLIFLLGAALTIYLLTKETAEPYVPKNVTVKENMVLDENTGLYTEDLHVHEANDKEYALDDEKSKYSVGELVFGKPVGVEGVAKSSKGGIVLGVLDNKVLAKSHPNYLYYYDLKEKEAKWITTVGTKAYLSQVSDKTLYFEYVDITMGVESAQKVMIFDNKTSKRTQIGNIAEGYKVLQGAINQRNAYYTISNDYGITKRVIVSDIGKGNINTAQQSKLDQLKINYLNDQNGKIYFASDTTKKIYVLDENENIVEIGSFEGGNIKNLNVYESNILVAVEDEQYIIKVFINGEENTFESFGNGYWVDEGNILIELADDGLYVYDRQDKSLDALKKGENDFYLVGNNIYYFDGKTDTFYTMKIENR